jgi:leucyl-tRNA synthetase
MTAEYNFHEIEKFAKDKWKAENVYKVAEDKDKPKYYVLDMFPYPSGAGLHVGHPLGYIASDIYARYKRLKGYNVLHPMGFDAFGLPAEQYAIQTGQHPAVTTTQNIDTYKQQLDKIGFSYDWDREVNTCDPQYYKWTQWIFIQLFNSIYCAKNQCAYDISVLVHHFEEYGNRDNTAITNADVPNFSAEEWKSYSKKQQQDILMNYRLAYQSDTLVNWCPELGTVLANDEVINGVSERGGHPVEKKKMSQWFLRITAYAERLLKGLDTLEWSDSMKEMQRNWIGKSTGAMVTFALENHSSHIEVFTTRVDTLFGVTFLVIAPEHALVDSITTADKKEEVNAYVKYCAAKSDIERQAEKVVSGQFTGAYVIHPITKAKIPVFIADYVLAGYGTGAVMAVPSGDQRDYLFAKKFDLPIIQILDAQQNLEEEADPTKAGKYINSGIINGMEYAQAVGTLIKALENLGAGYAKINYKMRDAGFSRQRYWGEPFPIYYDQDGIIHTLAVSELPLILPEVESFKPTGTGESPLATAHDWVNALGNYTYRETDTMPAYAGSSWYFLRYMDAHNDKEFVNFDTQHYWQDVDLYIGGTEHAVGHLLYSRFWHKFFKDRGWVSTEEPFRKLVNQGMILGRSLQTTEGLIRNIPAGVNIPLQYTSLGDKIYKYRFEALIKADNRFEEVDIEKDIHWLQDENGNAYISLKPEVEKMSKSKFNVINPDDIIAHQGADCFRLFEMFLGPIEAHKPWDTHGISGVSAFLRKFWKLFNIDESGISQFTEGEKPASELKILHKVIKKVNDDIERFSFNTVVSNLMIATNEFSKLGILHKNTLESLAILISPLAPFISEYLWHTLGNDGCIVKDAVYPTHDDKYLQESSINYPIQINGKLRANITYDAGLSPAQIQELVVKDENITKYFEGKSIKKIIVIPGKIINIVL